MKPVLIFRHLQCEGPGYLGEFLHRHRVPSRLIAIDDMQTVPKTLDDSSALVFMGGPMSVNDYLPWVDDELSLIKQAAVRNMPVLGHCLGGQLIAKALGAKVYPNAVKEIGWFEVTQTDADSPWLTEIPHRFEAFHWHGETFDLPPGAVHLFQSEQCHNQGFAHGAMLALQFHVEMTAEMVSDWADINRQELAHPGSGVQSYEAIISEVDKRVARLNVIAHALYNRWLALVIDRESIK